MTKTAKEIARELWENRHRWRYASESADPRDCSGELAFMREVVMTLERSGVPS